MMKEEVKRQKVNVGKLKEFKENYEKQVEELELKIEVTMKTLKNMASNKEVKTRIY